MVWLWFATAAAQVCPEMPAVVAVAEAESMLDAFDRLDTRSFGQGQRALDHALSCLDVPLEGHQSVQVHTAKALSAFVEGEPKAVERSWAAVKVLDPTSRPADRWGASHPLRAAFDVATFDDLRVTLEREPEGGWRVDGEPRPDVPANRAFLLQGVGPEGVLVHSGYHYSVAEVPQVDWAELDPTARARRAKRMKVLGTTLATALGAGALTTGTHAVVTRARMSGEDISYDELDGMQVSANTTGSVAAGLAAGAAGIATATWTINW